MFCVNNVSTIDGGLVDNNLFDRSGIPAANVKQDCVAIRGNSDSVQTSNWIFTNNKIIVPADPTDAAAECIEVRYMINSTINNNIFINGSIGLSIVGCYNVTASGNSCFNCVVGLEIAGGSYNVLDSNVVNGNSSPNKVRQGILLDGAVNAAAMYNTLSNNSVSGVTASCIQVYFTASYNNIIGGILIQTTSGEACVKIMGAESTLITGVKMNGVSTGSRGVMMDNSHYSGNGYLTNNTVINGCNFKDFSSSAIAVYATTGGAITGLRVTNNTLNTGTMLINTLTGATLPSPYYYGNSPELIGSKVILATGTNASAGTATLVAGTVTVSNNLVTSGSIIFLSVSAIGGTQGMLSYTKTAGTSFTITSSSNTDTSTVAWIIIN